MRLFNKIKLDSRLVLAPMAGISSYPFRWINRKFGCECAFFEMISAKGVAYSSKKTKEMLLSGPDDSPLGLQLLGCDPKYILRALEKLRDHKFDFIDFNAACPQKKVTSKGQGASLLKTPKKLRDLLKVIVKNSKRSVMVKIRLGWEDALSASEIALYAQDAGVKVICVHGRVKTQKHSGEVDYKSIREIKKVLSIPIIASGNIFTPQLAKKMFDETGADVLAIARGSLGNPWIFKQISSFIKKGVIISSPSVDEVVDVMKVHLDKSVDFFGEKSAVIRFRKFYLWYIQKFSKAKFLKLKITKISTYDQMAKIIEEFRVVAG